MSNEQTLEAWQIESNGEIFDTNFVEMTSWIDQGSLLRQDKVRKGNLRWIEAGKVPSLMAVFNARENGQPLPAPTITTTKLGPTSIRSNAAANPVNLPPPIASPTAADPTNGTQIDAPICSIHPDADAAYICDTCFSQFCKACPSSYGGTVKICPMCGAMCSPYMPVTTAAAQSVYISPATGGSFGFEDFGAALAYPFKFKLSLFLGALMYMFFSIGQSAVGFGGVFMLGGAIFSFMLANTLTFGILANTVENFSQGKIGDNFMPSFDDFSVWDDVIHPFFLSIGVYISSFGPFIAVCLVAFFMVIGSVSKEMNGLQSDAARAVKPDLPYAANAARQSEAVRELLNKQQNTQQKRVEAIEAGADDPDESLAPPVKREMDDEDFEKLQGMIQETRKAQLESAIGKAPETVAAERSQLVKQILGYGVLFLLVGGICLLWGLFYFPAACAVAGYTSSFAATVNPTVGIDTIRRLGVTYVKILAMGLAIVLMSGFIGGVINAALSAFDMPGVGNVPARAIGSLFGFYFSVVFSCVLGFALHKSADKLNLFQ